MYMLITSYWGLVLRIFNHCACTFGYGTYYSERLDSHGTHYMKWTTIDEVPAAAALMINTIICTINVHLFMFSHWIGNAII